MSKLEAPQLRYLFDTLANQIFEAKGGTGAMYQTTIDWMNSKKRNFPGRAYIEQLEKNSVYFAEATGSTRIAIVNLLCDGQPKLDSEQEISEYIRYVGMIMPQEEVHPKILGFVQGHINDKPQQFSDLDWYKLRSIRESGDTKKYIAELELLCRIYRVATDLSDLFLDSIFHHANLIGGARTTPRYEVNDVINQRVYFWANFCCGNLQMSYKGKPISEMLKEETTSNFSKTKKQKTWKFWK